MRGFESIWKEKGYRGDHLGIRQAGTNIEWKMSLEIGQGYSWALAMTQERVRQRCDNGSDRKRRNSTEET